MKVLLPRAFPSGRVDIKRIAVFIGDIRDVALEDVTELFTRGNAILFFRGTIGFAQGIEGP